MSESMQGSTLNGTGGKSGFDTARIEQELARPLAPELVSERPGPRGRRPRIKNGWKSGRSRGGQVRKFSTGRMG